MIIRALDRRPEQRQRRLSYRARVVSAISAFRGGVSLAIALSIPLAMKDGSPFPYRDEVVLVAALAIVIGMAVQGPLLPKVIAWAAKGGHTGDDEEAELTEEQLTTEGRLAILEAVRPELPALAEQAGVSPRVAEAMEERLDDIAAHIGADDEEEDVAEIVALERLHGADGNENCWASSSGNGESATRPPGSCGPAWIWRRSTATVTSPTSDLLKRF